MSSKLSLVGLCALLCGASVACGDESTAPDTTPPGPVTALAATVSGATVRLTWKEPADRDVSGSLLVRFPAAGTTAAPETGRSYTAGESLGAGQVVFAGRGTEATDTPPCRQHAYGAWARDASGNWSAAAQTVSVSGLPGSPLPPAPASATARVDGSGVALTWTLSGAAPASFRIVRKRGSAPTGPTDGDVVFSGTGGSARDAAPELNPLVTLHYAVFACNPCGDCEATGARSSVTPTLTQALRAGGYVIFWRHATASVCADRQELGPASAPRVADWWKSCERDCAIATARQLSQQGYDEADAIGAGVRAKGIPFSKVLSTEYCRGRETATHFALGPQTETIKELTFFVYPELDLCAEFNKLIAQPPSTAGNTALIAHLFLPAGGQPPCMDTDLAMGEAIVFKPDGRGGSTKIARVKPSEWATLP